MAFTRSMQLWPGGQIIHVRGEDIHNPASLEVKREREGDWRPPTKEEAQAVLIEHLAEMYAERDILCCDSALVSDLMKLAYEHHNLEPWSMENVVNLRPDSSDWTLEQCKEWLEDNGHDLPDPNPWDEDREGLIAMLGDKEESDEEGKGHKDDRTDGQLLAQAIEDMDDETIDGLDDWRQNVRDNAEDAEIYEWWRVNEWLARNLKDIGECVLDNDYGYWWGRCCTGQGLIMDGTLQKIARKYTKD